MDKRLAVIESQVRDIKQTIGKLDKNVDGLKMKVAFIAAFAAMVVELGSRFFH